MTIDDLHSNMIGWDELADNYIEHTAEIARLRAALEEIAEGRFYCADGACRAIETAQTALKGESE